jgi:hypothetical protein
MAESKQEFLKIYKNIKREGADKLLEWLSSTDFFTCPASTKFHSAHEGGLCEHSVNVYHRLLGLVKQEFGKDWEKVVSLESVTIMSLLHDVCKANTYKTELRNVKQDGNWVQQPFYTVEDSLPYGHGEKSVYIINGFMRLTREEAMAINWHMGGFDTRVRGGSYSLSDAFYKYPISVLMHVADILATYLDETA